jgi:hypothetical protein
MNHLFGMNQAQRRRTVVKDGQTTPTPKSRSWTPALRGLEKILWNL